MSGFGQVGVSIPAGQQRGNERAEPNKVLAVVPVEVVGVMYADGAGVVHKELWYSIVGVLYQPPGSEQFALGLKEVKEVLAKQVKTRLAALHSDNSDLPSKDAVDVVSASTAKETTKK